MCPATTPTPRQGAAPLEAVLTGAALGPVRRVVPDMSTARWAVALARQPEVTARRLAGLGVETGRILSGASRLEPSRRDRRFADVAWTQNPVLRRVVQLYLAAGRTVEELATDADLG